LYSSPTILKRATGSISAILHDFLWQNGVIRSLDVISAAIGERTGPVGQNSSGHEETADGITPTSEETRAVFQALGIEDLDDALSDRFFQESRSGNLLSYCPGALAALGLASQADVQIGIVETGALDLNELQRLFAFLPEPPWILREDSGHLPSGASSPADELTPPLTGLDGRVWFFARPTESDLPGPGYRGYRVATIGGGPEISERENQPDVRADRIDLATKEVLDREGIAL
jgi:hypothetical protein